MLLGYVRDLKTSYAYHFSDLVGLPVWSPPPGWGTTSSPSDREYVGAYPPDLGDELWWMVEDYAPSWERVYREQFRVLPDPTRYVPLESSWVERYEAGIDEDSDLLQLPQMPVPRPLSLRRRLLSEERWVKVAGDIAFDSRVIEDEVLSDGVQRSFLQTDEASTDPRLVSGTYQQFLNPSGNIAISGFYASEVSASHGVRMSLVRANLARVFAPAEAILAKMKSLSNDPLDQALEVAFIDENMAPRLLGTEGQSAFGKSLIANARTAIVVLDKVGGTDAEFQAFVEEVVVHELAHHLVHLISVDDAESDGLKALNLLSEALGPTNVLQICSPNFPSGHTAATELITSLCSLAIRDFVGGTSRLQQEFVAVGYGAGEASAIVSGLTEPGAPLSPLSPSSASPRGHDGAEPPREEMVALVPRDYPLTDVQPVVRANVDALMFALPIWDRWGFAGVLAAPDHVWFRYRPGDVLYFRYAEPSPEHDVMVAWLTPDVDVEGASTDTQVHTRYVVDTTAETVPSRRGTSFHLRVDDVMSGSFAVSRAYLLVYDAGLRTEAWPLSPVRYSPPALHATGVPTDIGLEWMRRNAFEPVREPSD